MKFLEVYSPLINSNVIRWIHLRSGTNKCNIDGSGIDSFDLFVRNAEGDFIYNEKRVLEHVLLIES